MNISIIIVTYNSKDYIDDCINSIFNQKKDSIELIIVDNNSTDNTIDHLKKYYKNKIKIIENDLNKGYGYANNLGVKYAKGKFIIIMNPDIIVEHNFIEELINPLINNNKLITTPKVLLFNEDKINTCGLKMHFTGLGFTRGYKKDKNYYKQQEFVSGLFGGCFAIKKEDYNSLGGFDENIFLYGEDTELSWRAHLKGFKILFTPKSIIKHDYTLKVPPKKIYYLEKSRYILLRKYLNYEDFILLFPSLILSEILTLGYAIRFRKKGIYYKFISIREAFSEDIKKIHGDNSNLFKSLEPEIPTDLLTYNKSQLYLKKIINKIFFLNWKVHIYFKG